MEPAEPSFPFRAGSDAPPGVFLMVLALSGLVRVECDPSGQTLAAGCLLLAPPGSRARVRGGSGAAFDSFSCAPSLVDAFASESSLGAAVEALATKVPRSARLAPPDFQEARALFAYIVRRAGEAREERLPMVRLKVMELLLLLGPLPEAVAAVRFRAEDLKRHIEERHADQITLDGLAGRFGLSPAYLSRSFSRETGFTIVEYLNRIRIHKSCLLLKRSGASILDISVAVGYNNLSHFNRCFRRHTGMSPREFRDRSRR